MNKTNNEQNLTRGNGNKEQTHSSQRGGWKGIKVERKGKQ